MSGAGGTEGVLSASGDERDMSTCCDGDPGAGAVPFDEATADGGRPGVSEALTIGITLYFEARKGKGDSVFREGGSGEALWSPRKEKVDPLPK